MLANNYLTVMSYGLFLTYLPVVMMRWIFANVSIIRGR